MTMNNKCHITFSAGTAPKSGIAGISNNRWLHGATSVHDPIANPEPAKYESVATTAFGI
jgi:hypothetical protein